MADASGIAGASEKGPLVSAVMPAFNSASTIAQAIESVLGQTFEDWELLVVDDGSTDETALLASGFEDPRVRVHQLAHKGGRGEARNHAVRAATGEFVAICDSDDISLPHRFERQVDYLLANPHVGVVSSQVLFFTDSEAPKATFRVPTESEAIKKRMMQGRSVIPNQASMIRRKLFESVGFYESTFVRAQDYEFFLRAMDVTDFHTIDEPLLLYRQNDARLPFSYWREASLYERFALYWHRHRVQGKEMPTVKDFSRQPLTVVRMWTIDLARFLWVRGRARYVAWSAARDKERL